ncbi:SUKH-4 family immunity protein [Streptomyces sp. CA2R106]|uniref:SUKH-4 family immunity protein n=1 Tax=Streptomyces sp. CA2R106 TaxID=3120153 RepID=UPI003007F869
MIYGTVRVSSSSGDVSLEVPREFYNYRASGEVWFSRRAEGGVHWGFGKIEATSDIYVRASNGEIWAGHPEGEPVFVNSSLSRFSASVRRMVLRWPYYSEDSDYGDWEAAAQSLQEDLRAIDPESIERDGYWAEFVSAVEMGDF